MPRVGLRGYVCRCTLPCLRLTLHEILPHALCRGLIAGFCRIRGRLAPSGGRAGADIVASVLHGLQDGVVGIGDELHARLVLVAGVGVVLFGEGTERHLHLLPAAGAPHPEDPIVVRSGVPPAAHRLQPQGSMLDPHAAKKKRV